MFLGFVECYAKIGGVLVVLAHAKVTLGDCERTVIVDVHYYNRGSSGFPGGVAKGFAKAVATYVKGDIGVITRRTYYAIGLHSAYGFACCRVWEERFAGRGMWKVKFQRGYDIFV